MNIFMFMQMQMASKSITIFRKFGIHEARISQTILAEIDSPCLP